MILTQKETMLLQDLKTQEEVCVKKYKSYAKQAYDSQLQHLFSSIGDTEAQHLNTISELISAPSSANGSSSMQKAQPCQKNDSLASSKEFNQYLLKDALSTEKHVSSVYDTCIFEFKDMHTRDTLNHIQKEEQNHGKLLYDYMSQNGMY